jgi:hypothetical protein
MRNLFLATLFIAIVPVVGATTKIDASTCESIKEKQVRIACIESRNELVAAKIEAYESKLSEKAEAYEARMEGSNLIVDKKPSIASNVAKAKADLTKNYKDPVSAQFSNLTLRESDTEISLCGSVNAKNSYGGYVGVKKFYVNWQKITPSRVQTWHGGENEKYLNSEYPSVREIARNEMLKEYEAFHKLCDMDKNSIVTMIN